MEKNKNKKTFFDSHILAQGGDQAADWNINFSGILTKEDRL